MGLIYNPSDSRGIVSALNGNIRTAEEMVEGLNRASRHLINALNGKELSGAAYTAGKGMFSQLVIPTISKASEALEKLKSETKKYEGFASSAGDELLDEDKLNEKLQSLQAQQAALSSQIDFFKQQAMSHKEDSGLSTSFTNYSNTLSSYMSTVAEDIQEVQKKLKKLHEFNSNVNGFFSDARSDFEKISDIVSVLGNGHFNSNGQFNAGDNNNKQLLLDIISDYGSGAVQDGLSEGIGKFLETMDTSIPNAGAYMHVFSDGNKYWKNTHISWDGAGYGKAMSSSLLKKGVQNVTVKSFGVGKAKVSGLGILGFGIDYNQNLADGESVGMAFTHTAATTAVTSAGVLAVGASASAAAAGTFGAGAVGAGAAVSTIIASNPIGWAIGAGIAMGGLTKLAYDQNFLGFQDGVKNAGEVVNSGLESIKSVFGWGKTKHA